MKISILSLRLMLAVAAVMLAAGTPERAGAATYYYDNDSDTNGFGTAGGTWAAPTPGPTPGWTTSTDGTAVPGSVTTTTSDPVNFGNGATGLGAGTITLSGALSCGNMTFASGSGAIVLTNGTSLTLPASATITVNNTSDTIATPLLGGITLTTISGTGTLVLQGSYATARTYSISSGAVLNLNGGGGWSTSTFNGAGTLRLSGGSFPGTSAATMALSAGGLIDIPSGATLVNPYNSNVRINWASNLASMTVNGTFDINDGAGPIVDALNGSGTITRNRNTVGNTTLTVGVNNGSGTFTGNIIAQLKLTPNGPAILKKGTGTQILSGSGSTYGGSTTIQAGSLVAGANAPSGANGVFGNSSGAIVLGNGSTLADDAPALLINGAFTVGRAITVGSVANTAAYNATIGGINTSDTATYTGSITLNTTAANYTVTLRAATGGTTEFKTGTWTSNDKALAIGSSGNTGTVKLSNALATT
ncbi:MAG: autotransporter-associated beta strand repeat-containing protein, partial [Kiritimatiellaeota bacterium]|nr:autotransporter-associated beta strand repeat-containing protein [Kiritimatiellota bacterium]